MKTVRFFLALFVLLSFGSTVRAAQQPQTSPPGTKTSSQAVLIATVNLQNAVITAQNGHTFAISFDFTNGVPMQPSVKYGVQLVSTSSKSGNSIIDEYIFPDSLSLNENVTVHKTITYTAPANVGGTYELYLVSDSSTGFPLGIDDVGSVTLASSSVSVVLTPATCYLTIQGEKGLPRYALLQGVDIKPTETLLLNCAAVNNTTESVTLTPNYETHYRSLYGDIVAASGGDMAPVTLKAHETKTLTLALPKAATPQSYDVVVSLAGSLASNVIDAHYVIQGSSATVQTLSLDKDNYVQGATADVSFLWTAAADTFPGSRAGTSTPSATQVSVLLQSGNDACAAPVTEPPPQGAITHVFMPIVRSCSNPHVIVTLLAANGTVLATGELTRATPITPVAWVSILGIVCIAVFVLTVFAVYLRKRRQLVGHA